MVGLDKICSQDGGAEVEQDHSLPRVVAGEGVDDVTQSQALNWLFTFSQHDRQPLRPHHLPPIN